MGLPDQTVRDVARDQTLAAGSKGASANPKPAIPNAASPRATVDGQLRTTVLPRRAPTAERPAIGNERRFEVVQVLGAGGMGEVALAEDRDIQRKVALKRMHADARNGETLHRFAEEVRIIGQLEHPNITPVHDVGIDESGQHYFVMKFVDGETLETIIAKLKSGEAGYAERYSIEARIDIFLGILHAIRYAHARGIVHRDLKPANIMVGRYGEVTVVDWGIARKLDAAPEAPGELAGTPMYMSPEQAGGAPVDQRTDLYSLCLVLLEMLTLSHPLAGKASTEAVLATLVTDGVEAGLTHVKLLLVAAGAPNDFAALISRGLQHDRAKRFASIDELEQAVRDVREGRVPVSCHITFSKRAVATLARFIDRRPWVYTALAVTTLASVLGLAGVGIAHLLH
jgi:serine/threonine-protein kinase